MTDRSEQPSMTFEEFRRSFYYGSRTDLRFKFLASLPDDAAADAVARILRTVGQACDTGDWDAVQDAVIAEQDAAYGPADPVEATVADAPFAPVRQPLPELPLALITAGGVFRRGDDPLGPDGPSQQEVLGREHVKRALSGPPSLSEISVDTPPAELTARHPGYDATSAHRDPNAVFPLDVLREVAETGGVSLASTHYGFVGATAQGRLRDRVAPEWAQRLLEAKVGAALLVAT
ncbi:MAG: hypothetical protein GEV00_16070 [Actinophytocola sp.]|nr:hypothetical protein [Actinophytocola sp.]